MKTLLRSAVLVLLLSIPLSAGAREPAIDTSDPCDAPSYCVWCWHQCMVEWYAYYNTYGDGWDGDADGVGG